MTDAEIQEVAAKLAERLKSPEGQASLKEAISKTQQALEALRKASKVEYGLLYKRVTI